MVDQLLPPNASALERDLEQSMAHYGDERETLIGRLWQSKHCPLDLLPWLAWALGVRRWDPAWPEMTRREVVANAIAQHRVRGTLGAVKAAFDDIGAVYDLTERPNGAAHTMAISIFNSNVLLGETSTADIKRYIEDAKRFSTHYTLSISSSLGNTDIAMGVAAAGTQIADIALAINEAA